MSDASIRVSDLTFAWPDGSPVLENLSFKLGPIRTGLVAPNGAGKSTLLKLLAGRLTPQSGFIEVHGHVGYVPQQFTFDGSASVADLLGVTDKLDALVAIASGAAHPGLFETIGEDWDLQERASAALTRIGMADVSLRRPLGTFSGGEMTWLALAAQLLRRPEVLLLDEPSNNLDRLGRQRLYELVDSWSGCLLVVSHDRELLAHVEQIGEMTGSALRLYGGAYDAYREAAQVERQAVEQDVRNFRQEVRREKYQAQQARERADRKEGSANRNLASAGMPRIAAGNRKRAAEVATGKSGRVHAARERQARLRLSEAEGALRDVATPDLSFPEARVPSGRLVFSGSGLCVRPPGPASSKDCKVDLIIRGPERIAISGANGAGKTTLLRQIAGELAFATGNLQRGPGRVAYLSQRLDLLDPERTVAESLAIFAPNMPDPERANLLARLQFRGARMDLRVRDLSGGERLRAVLACILHAEPAAELLLLDEPTNNLDLASIAYLEQSLLAYEGALVVVSHDEQFLGAIGVSRRLELIDGRLVERM